MTGLLVGEYLLKRLQELGIRSIFGVPGDYELAFLDLILKLGISWEGTRNELIAAYAADGYSRINGVGALVTTFGPGETSALCGIAGAFTEFVPLVHIVGYPSMTSQRAHAILHHTLGEGKFQNYHEMSKQISCATTVLEDSVTAASEIDRVLEAMMYYGRPVYIGIPTDVAMETISGDGLLVPLKTGLDPNDEVLERKVVSTVWGRIEASNSPIIIVDGGATRNRLLTEVAELIDVLKVPVFSTPMGKGAVNERSGYFCGVYMGAGSKKDVVLTVESSDCVLWIGNYPADLNTGVFTENVAKDVIVDFQRFSVTIGLQKYRVKMKGVFRALIRLLKARPLPAVATPLPCQPYSAAPTAATGPITHGWIWPRLGKFLRPNDLVIVETGTSRVGFQNTPLPEQVTVWMQVVYGSIGYATGALLGAAVARKEQGGGRCILITGDGSLQLTIQAIADMLSFGANVHIFVINNSGYTVERVIHGRDQEYNDIPAWNYSEALRFLNPGVPSKSYVAGSVQDLEALLSDAAFGEPHCPKLVEVMMDKFDAPPAMRLAAVGTRSILYGPAK